MGDFETKEKRSRNRKRNFYAKSLRDNDEYEQKVVNPKKGFYKREKVSLYNYDQIED